jgi:hypothetical protein
MKFVFKEIGPGKVSKIVEVSNLPNANQVDFALTEMKPYMPEKGRYEVVPLDELPDFVSNRYIVVYTDSRYVTHSMGMVLVYH